MTDHELRRLIELGEQATGLPWDFRSDSSPKLSPLIWGEDGTIIEGHAVWSYSDVEYIVAAANAATALAAELLAARQRITELEETIDSADQYGMDENLS